MKSGDTVIYTSPKTGRQTEVVILDISPAGAKVAQVADRSKVLDCRTSCLKTREQMTERAAQDAAERQKWSALNEHLARKDRYTCLECGSKHNRRTCPNCGSPDKIETV